ncbi:MAG: ribonuclease J [Patescibacteria group bacterium]|nr:ribonuclease J [Patescibacteria group bacterium]
MKQTKQLKFIPLGGVEDVNRNCYVVEYGKDIVVVDLGISLPETSHHGVDCLIPDVDYLKRRRDRIAGILITHGHLDHLGAIPYVIEDLGFPPIYGRALPMKFLEEKLREYHLDKKVKLNIIEPGTDIKLKSITARFISVTHSIPHSCSIFIKTPGGNILHTGDFKFDERPVNEPKSDYEGFRRAAKEGVDLLSIDSTNIYCEGKAKTETEIHQLLDRVVQKAKGRVIVATFSSLGTRMYSLINIAQKYGRKVAVTGRSMKTMIRLLREIGYIKVQDNVFVSEKSLKKVPDDRLLVLATGTQGEEFAALSRMARDDHRFIKVKKSDTIIISSRAIPGNLVPIQHLIDGLIKKGARVIHKSFMDVHTSGHGYQEDLKQMYKLTNPRFVMPVHGYQSFLYEHKYLLGCWGMKKKNIIVAQTGQVFALDPISHNWSVVDKVNCKEVFVEGGMVNEVGSVLIAERESLASYGVILIVVNLDKNFSLVQQPILVTKGFVYVKHNKSVLQDLEQLVKKEFKRWRKSQSHISSSDIPRLRSSVSRVVSNRVFRKMRKRPVVETMVVL